MKRVLLALTVVSLLLQSFGVAQTKPLAPAVVLIKAGRLIDVRGGRVLENQESSRAAILYATLVNSNA